MPAHVCMSGNLTWNGERIASNVDRIVPQIFTGIINVGRGDEENLLFIKHDGSLWGVGANQNGQLGDGTTIPRDTPVHIADNVIFACAFTFVMEDGSMWIWCAEAPVPRLYHTDVAAINGAFVYFTNGAMNMYNTRFGMAIYNFAQEGWVDTQHSGGPGTRVPRILRFY